MEPVEAGSIENPKAADAVNYLAVGHFRAQRFERLGGRGTFAVPTAATPSSISFQRSEIFPVKFGTGRMIDDAESAPPSSTGP